MEEFIPDRPFEYFFLDARLASSYKAEQKLSVLTTIFSGLAIIVACMGLFGLATFTTEQRTKEIGIRKVLGINSSQVMVLLSQDFMILIVLALALTVPISIYAINTWLDGFAYRVSIGVLPYLIAGLVVFLVAFFTVAYHSLKALNINPVNILKEE